MAPVIFVMSDDPAAYDEFVVAAASHADWTVTRDPDAALPLNNASRVFITAQAAASDGGAGLRSLSALLISLEANFIVGTLSSAWSRLLSDLHRLRAVPLSGGNRTEFIDIVGHLHTSADGAFVSFRGSEFQMPLDQHLHARSYARATHAAVENGRLVVVKEAGPWMEPLGSISAT